MSSTLYLNPDTWDLALDASGNIAVATEPYALAQDAASAIRTFKGECWYDTTQGLPYWQQILGHYPALSLVRSKMVTAAENITNVASATVYFTGFTDRQLQGQVQVTDSSGDTSAATF
ncbi:hypothetical protein [Paraburkholderia tropica]|uniref:hypothetical protein n=1 Tax=Paraburkholderia tropica TaxID=92647 RepID=UPI002AB5E370|nr:hypothetical protein [Paraburkholderia tropica]